MSTVADSSPSVDRSALRSYRLDRVRRELARCDYAAAVLYDPVNIRYATDTSNMQVWTLHNPVRYAFVPAQGPVVLFEFHGCAHLADGFVTVDEVRPAIAWYYFGAGSRVEEMAARWAAEVADLVRDHGGGNRCIAADRLDPLGVAALSSLGVSVHDGQEVMEQARLIKSADEIDAMRASIAACQAGMRAMRDALRPGISENELWSHLHQTNIAHGGEWIETRLLTSGTRTNPWFQECGERVIQAGDIVSFDTDLIGPYGYCADISRTWLCGDGRPTDEQRRLYAMAHEQVHRNVERVRVGMSFKEFTECGVTLPEPYVRQRYSVFAHGVGLCDEYPSILYPEDFEQSGYDGILQENMTICVESYVGEPGGAEGVKLEEQVLLTANGAVPLSTYPFEDDFL